MTSTVLLERDGPVARLTLNRPDKLNALDDVMSGELRAAMLDVEKDEAIRVVLLKGAGNAFMAGGDVALFHAQLAELQERFGEMGAAFHDAIHAMRRMGKPVVASVHGVVAGGGLSVMLACDLAIAAEGTQFTLAYANIGTSPDGGSTHFLPRIVGLRRALELAFLPDRFEAKRAAELGLINWVVPAAELASATDALLRRLASGPTAAFGRAKALLNASFERPFAGQLEDELESCAASAATADFKEGVTAFVQKRPPRFEGR